MVVSFDKYRRRAERLKRLEAVQKAAKALVNAVMYKRGVEVIFAALNDLKTAVERVEYLPPPSPDDNAS